MSKLAVKHRRGVTLVELLVVCAVLGVLMGMVLFALQGATETARADRTRAEVVKINDLIMTRWEGYRQRPLPMRPQYLVQLDGKNPNNIQLVAEARLRITWELMRMELPERISDIEQPAQVLKVSTAGGPVPLQPALWSAYRRKAEALTGTTWPAVTTKWSGKYANAECLYLILSTIHDGDTRGLDFFTSREVGDIDGDGMPEIHDGWGNPIFFLRWAPGYTTSNGMPTTIQTGDPITQPDPFDPFRYYKDNANNALHFAMFPLIYSAGPDPRKDASGDVSGYGINITTHDYAALSPAFPPYPAVKNYPYATLTSGAATAAGAAVQENGYDTHLDNITNHLTVTR